MIKCPWDGTPFEPVKRGKHEKRFASVENKHAYEKAAKAFGEHMASTMPPGVLKEWWEAQQKAEIPSRATHTEQSRQSEGAG